VIVCKVTRPTVDDRGISVG